MSDHKSNPRATQAAMLPPLLPTGVIAGVILDFQVDAKEHVRFFPTECIRIGEEGITHVRFLDSEEWIAPAPGLHIHELGKPLPPELCDVTIVLATATQDTLDKPLLVPGCSPPAPKVSTIPHFAIARMPLVEWQSMHMANLRGGNPS